jgi:hypothetical protein
MLVLNGKDKHGAHIRAGGFQLNGANGMGWWNNQANNAKKAKYLWITGGNINSGIQSHNVQSSYVNTGTVNSSNRINAKDVNVNGHATFNNGAVFNNKMVTFNGANKWGTHIQAGKFAIQSKGFGYWNPQRNPEEKSKYVWIDGGDKHGAINIGNVNARNINAGNDIRVGSNLYVNKGTIDANDMVVKHNINTNNIYLNRNLMFKPVNNPGKGFTYALYGWDGSDGKNDNNLWLEMAKRNYKINPRSSTAGNLQWQKTVMRLYPNGASVGSKLTHH